MISRNLSTAWKVSKYGVFSCIQSEYRKIQTSKNFVFGHFSRSEEFGIAFFLMETYFMGSTDIYKQCNLCEDFKRDFIGNKNILTYLNTPLMAIDKKHYSA